MINPNGDSEPSVYLIDYGFSAKFLKENKIDHIDENEMVDTFQGNMIFSSLNQMKFKKTSRRDDLISLFYMMIYCLNNN